MLRAPGILEGPHLWLIDEIACVDKGDPAHIVFAKKAGGAVSTDVATSGWISSYSNDCDFVCLIEADTQSIRKKEQLRKQTRIAYAR